MKSSKSKKKSTKSNKKHSKKSTKHGKSKRKLENLHNKLKVPSRHSREPYKTMTIARKQTTVSKDVACAIKLKTDKNENKNFLKLETPGDTMDSPAYKVGMPDPFSATLFAPPVSKDQDAIHYVYNTYNFMDDLTKYDIYRRAAHFSALNPKRASAYDEDTLTGMAVCSMFDMKRRKEKLVMCGKGRPAYDNYGRRMLESPRALVAKQQKYSQPFFGHIITSNKHDVKKNMITATQKLKQSFQSKEKVTRMRLTKFTRRNQEWVKDRMMCKRMPLFLKVPRNLLYTAVVNSHARRGYRRRGDQDLFNEFNYLSSHFAFSVHFCRVMETFQVKKAKEDAVIEKISKMSPLIRVGMTRYSHFPAISVVNFDENNALQTTLPRIPRRAPSIGAVSGYSSDSRASVATDTPLDWELDWKLTDKELEHRLNFIGDVTRRTVQVAAEKHYNERRWKELVRRRRLLLKVDRRFELQDTVPIFQELPKMHPSLIFCKLKSMELNKLRRTRFSERTAQMEQETRAAMSYLISKRIQFLERTLPCKNDPRIVMTEGWRVFAAREDPSNFKNVARILKQRSSWVAKNCMSRSATVPRCDRLPMRREGTHKKAFLVLLLLLTLALSVTTMSMISFI